MHAEWVQDYFNDFALVNHGHDAHEVLADWATERVGVPNLNGEGTAYFRHRSSDSAAFPRPRAGNGKEAPISRIRRTGFPESR